MKKIEFTNLKRSETIATLKETEFDLIVIGGGITGAGIALDASSRGMKVALVEKGDYASGTSSRSTKLIHGGLRYLKQFDFWLVKEVGSERAIVHKLAPHLVLPEKMLLPLIENGQYGKWLTSIGLKVYDILAQVEGEDKRKMLEKKEAMKLEPLLPKKILKGAGYYAEYRTDDARLTIENIKTGLQYGSVPINYTKVVEFLYDEEEHVSGVIVKDELSDEQYEIHSKYVISAAGPWVDDLRKVNHSKKGKRLHLTKGVHLVFPHEKLPVKQSVYFDVPDGRMIFAVPRGKITYVGTTDTNYNDDKDDIGVNLADTMYILSAVNNMFPNIDLEMEDIISSWAGLRPLIHEEGKSTSELSRKDEIFVSYTGLISIAGGKLTGYRKMAERVVNRIAKKFEEEHKIEFKEVFTDKIVLSGGPFKNFKEVKKYIKTINQQVMPLGFSEYDGRYLVTTYGKQSEVILEEFEKIAGDSIHERLILAELRFSTKYEQLQSPVDFFIYRTGRMYFDIDSVRKHHEAVLKEFQRLFKVDEATISNYQDAIRYQIERHSKFDVERV
ncbi:glycerol-3-phosphate dehydrogenase/oxidase [Sungkyunkwania multivorans]|uniref:Glycerol-3-phosphate dehydrogenase n=1 Tax=Sungkyunkwania multivorans TaxID=1173618 RepID=A0ABW3D1G7_9FLAO